MAVHRFGILQYVHDLFMHDAGTLVHTASRAGRSEVVRLGHTVDQSSDFGNNTGTHGIWGPHRRYMHLVERNVRW